MKAVISFLNAHERVIGNFFTAFIVSSVIFLTVALYVWAEYGEFEAVEDVVEEACLVPALDK